MIKSIKSIIVNRVKRRIREQGQLITYRQDPASITKLIQSLHPRKFHRGLIRFGGMGDGGYLIPNDLDDIVACYSPGVDKISDFELDCYRAGMQVFLADYSVDGPTYTEEQFVFDFKKKFVGAVSNEKYITLDEWVNEKNGDNNGDLLLQMDIEGAEYETIINISPSLLKRFRILTIEFHNLNRLWHHDFYHIAETVFNKILQTHVCVHIHPNNCAPIYEEYGISIPPYAEFTFIRKDRMSNGPIQYEIEFPNILDVDNTNNTSVSLPRNWYQS